jgi:hypothetical protein
MADFEEDEEDQPAVEDANNLLEDFNENDLIRRAIQQSAARGSSTTQQFSV